MSDTLVARRYAQALYEQAEQAGRGEQVAEDMRSLQDSLDASRDLRQLFLSPVIPRHRKQAAVRKLFTGKVDEQVVRLVELLISKGRESMLSAVVAAYARLRDERMGRVEARVRTAMQLGPEQTEALKSALTRVTGREVVLQIEVDPDLISGLVVRVGDKVYDGSAQHHLENLREQFAASKFLSN
jgi:F-type H+-transporting ATPase subunit delta